MKIPLQVYHGNLHCQAPQTFGSLTRAGSCKQQAISNLLERSDLTHLSSSGALACQVEHGELQECGEAASSLDIWQQMNPLWGQVVAGAHEYET